VDEWALVSGASDGIGEGYARALAKRGLNLIILARTKEKLDNIAENIRAIYKVQVRVIPFDFSVTLSEYQPLFDQLNHEDLKGKITVLVNNVGGSGLDAATHTADSLKLFIDRDYSVADSCFQINLRPTLALTKLVASQLRDAKVNRGRIINVSSVAGTLALPHSAPYSGSKAFINAFTRSLVPELSQFGIKIEAHAPGNVYTRSNRAPMGLTCCEVGVYVDHSLNQFGTGNVVYPFWPHLLQSFALRFLPEFIVLPLAMKKRHSDKKLALAELESESKKAK